MKIFKNKLKFMQSISRIICTLLVLFMFQEVKSEVKLPAVVSSNMVLQRNTTVVLWGWADANEKISITTSWIEKEIDLIASKKGTWKVEVQTTDSKDAQSINIYSKDSNILLENILFGEVWVCAGQSNMEQPVKGYFGQPTFGTNNAIARSNNSNLRLFLVHREGSKFPLKDFSKYQSWQKASPESVENFSAVAYYFGQQLQEILDVPVGVIQSAWGGSIVEAWMSKDALKLYQEIDITKANLNKANKVQTALYNAMINPLIPFTVKGALWYQGEANRMKPNEYKKLFPAMVKDWRSRWGIGDFPFYFVQIAPYKYSGNSSSKIKNNTAFMRESQLECESIIPNSGIVVTLDVGDEECIHPPNKKPVADRLLFTALSRTYGYTAINSYSPVYVSKEIKQEEILLHFKHAEAGLYVKDKLKGFEIAGEDRVFYPAEAKVVQRKMVAVKSQKVPRPIAVRYAWRNWVVGTLSSTNMLPVSSFRTDDWEDAKNYVKQ